MNDVVKTTPPTTDKTPPETLDADFAQLFAELRAEVEHDQRKGRTYMSVKPDDLETVLNRVQPSLGALEQDGDTGYRLMGSSCWIGVDKHVIFIRKKGHGVVAVEIYDDTPGRKSEVLAEAVATTSSS